MSAFTLAATTMAAFFVTPFSNTSTATTPFLLSLAMAQASTSSLDPTITSSATLFSGIYVPFLYNRFLINFKQVDLELTFTILMTWAIISLQTTWSSIRKTMAFNSPPALSSKTISLSIQVPMALLVLPINSSQEQALETS